ncbi:hypothetical protein FACS1894130_03210 [Spirochaetia bacterium]|nr:hypothetical protein FACS1894130_03210 [Spirochaetia bacterium]
MTNRQKMEQKMTRKIKQTGTIGSYLKEKQELALEERYKRWLDEKTLEEVREQDRKRVANSREVYWIHKMLDENCKIRADCTKYELLTWDLCYKGVRTDNEEGLQFAEMVAKSEHGFTDEEWKEFLV